MIEQLVQNLLYFLIASGVIAFIIRSLFKQLLNKDIEKFKNRLFLEKIKFSKLHEERAKVIKELYEKLVDFENSMISLTKPIQWIEELKEKEKLKISSKKGNEFENYCKKNKIYFDGELCEILDEISKEMKKSWTDFYVYPGERETLSKEEISKKWEIRISAWRRIHLKVQPLKDKLEEEFRKMLGVKE